MLLEVHAAHIHDELMRVEFARSQLVSDHPPGIGGAGTGPTPGEMVLMALSAASALAGRKLADHEGLNVGHIGARASLSIHQDGFPGALNEGPLPALSYLGRVWRRLEIEGDITDAEAARLIEAMTDTLVSLTVSAASKIDEKLVCVRHGRGRAPLPQKSEFYSSDALTSRMAEGETRVVYNADNWRVSATALDPQTCLVKAAGTLTAMGDRQAVQHGPTPEEMLLAGLASCTTVYVARNAALLEIPVESVKTTVRAEASSAPRQPLQMIEKICVVSGDLTPAEIAKLEIVARYCAIGESLNRGIPLVDEIEVVRTLSSSRWDASIQALTRAAPRAADANFCNDGACCLPSPVPA